MNKFLIPVILSIIILLGFSTVYGAEHEENLIPEWIKIVVVAWANGDITDNEYMTAMSYLIETNIIPMNLTSSSITDEEKRLYELEIANRDNTILILNSTFSDMASLEIQVEELETSIEAKESELATRDITISNLELQITDFEKSNPFSFITESEMIVNLNNEIITLNVQVNGYEGRINELEKDNESLRDKAVTDDVLADLETMRLLFVESDAKRSDLDEENKLLKKQLESLLKTVESLNQN